MLAFSAACERNKGPILDQLRIYLPASGNVLEIGSGTGQHAANFAAALPGVRWQATEVPPNLPALAERLALTDLPNLPPPLPLDVLGPDWPSGAWDAAFTANTLHILDWSGAKALLAGVARSLSDGRLFFSYGPFMRHGQHTSESNAIFDAELRARNQGSALRDIDDLEMAAAEVGLGLVADIGLPANNQLLVWRRTPTP